MKTTTFIPAFLLAGLSFASPLAVPTANGWQVNDGDESSPYNFQLINANTRSFFLGKGTSSSCPSTVKNCPAGTSTAFRNITSTPGPMFLDSRVPSGGQRVYVARNGALKFLAPGQNLTQGARINGFYQSSDGFMHFATAKSSDVGFFACSTSSDYQTFQIFVGTVALDQNNCGLINLENENGITGYAAYQYV